MGVAAVQAAAHPRQPPQSTSVPLKEKKSLSKVTPQGTIVKVKDMQNKVRNNNNRSTYLFFQVSCIILPSMHNILLFKTKQTNTFCQRKVSFYTPSRCRLFHYIFLNGHMSEAAELVVLWLIVTHLLKSGFQIASGGGRRFLLNNKASLQCV